MILAIRAAETVAFDDGCCVIVAIRWPPGATHLAHSIEKAREESGIS
jgi:hypothetical protein